MFAHHAAARRKTTFPYVPLGSEGKAFREDPSIFRVAGTPFCDREFCSLECPFRHPFSTVGPKFHFVVGRAEPLSRYVDERQLPVTLSVMSVSVLTDAR
jgi:hypothetical protein